MRARIADPAIRRRLVSDMERNLTRRGGAASLLMTSSRDSSIVGKTLADIAVARKESPIDAALQIITNGGSSVASFNMKDADIEKFLVQPWVMTGSDGSTGHPRKYGTFPRVFREYVYRRKLLALPQAVQRSSQLTAETLGLRGRGVLRIGAFADVVAFDPNTFADKATYVHPEELAVGMRYVLVNGTVAVDGGHYSGALAGRALRRSGSGNATIDHASHVEIRRTTHGVPHIKADNLAAAEFALAYVQSEDYGARVAFDLIKARGEMGRWFGRDSIERDFAARLAWTRAVETYALLDQETRAVYEGFASGVNRYVELHAAEFPAHFVPRFTGYDVLAHDVYVASPAQAARALASIDPSFRRVRTQPDAAQASPAESDEPMTSWLDVPDEGSNAWAFAPSRTTSKRAILLRNPHLAWSAGYYEAHVAVKDTLDFYGDFRIGGPFGVIGGFNRDLGWSTTNNDPLLGQVYALDLDRARPDHYLLDGATHAVLRDRISVEYRSGDSLAIETREIARTPYGPVVHRDSTKLYVLRAGMDGDFRAGEQFLRMMRARSLAEWKGAMGMRARLNSSFTYADRAGNILYLWNGTVPSLPQGRGSDSVVVQARGVTDIWTHYVPFDSLPQVLNPRGGYVHNENDAPWFTNMREPLDPASYPSWFPSPRLGLRSQLAISLIDSDRKLNLQDVLTLKHSYRMLLAERVRDDLVSLVRATHPGGDTLRAIDVIAKWDGTTAPDSKGGVLFELWWRRYVAGARPDTMFAVAWSASAPTSTPHGIRTASRATDAFSWAVREATKRYGAFDVAWGDVHRVRVGDVDVPVGGCNGDLGCFRVLWFKDDPDGKRSATGGDGWILAIEFGSDRPHAYSVLAYGESPRPDSPYHADQAAMFARKELKPVAWSESEIERSTIRRYRPGIAP